MLRGFHSDQQTVGLRPRDYHLERLMDRVNRMGFHSEHWTGLVMPKVQS